MLRINLILYSKRCALDDFDCAPLRVYALLPERRLMPMKVRIFLDTLEIMSRAVS